MNQASVIFCVGSIESVSGWSGAHANDPPSAVPATIPGAKQKPGLSPDCFVTSEGEPMFSKNFPTLQFADLPRLEVKADNSGRISGWGAVFGNVDSYNERILPGAFAKSLAEHSANGTRLKMLWQHRPDVPIGNWEVAKEDGKGLYVEGYINLKTTAGRDAFEHIAGGDVDGLSIGYREKRVEQNRDGVRDLLELDVFEVSPVTFPANRSAGISAAKSETEVENMLRGLGLPKQAARVVLAGGWKALSKQSGIDEAAAAKLIAEIERATNLMKGI